MKKSEAIQKIDCHAIARNDDIAEKHNEDNNNVASAHCVNGSEESAKETNTQGVKTPFIRNVN